METGSPVDQDRTWSSSLPPRLPGSRSPLDDSSGLFNSSLDGNTRRAIDLGEGEKVDEEAFKALIREAVALNVSRS